MMFYKSQDSIRASSRAAPGRFGDLTKPERGYALSRRIEAGHRALSIIGSTAVLYAMLTSMATAQPPCANWGTSEFFAIASVEDVVRCLEEDRVEINSRDEVGRTPLHMAAEYNANPNVIHLLLSAGADINTRTIAGWTPLHVAAQYNANPNVINALLSAGAEVNARNEMDRTPLHVAVFADDPAAIGPLLSAGAEIDVRTRGGVTPLHLASANNQSLVMIEALLSAGAEINAQDADGWTPLHSAALFNQDPAVIDILLDAGADARTQNKDGLTPWDFAQDNVHINGTDAWWRLNDARFE